MQCSTDEKRNGCANVRVWVMVAMLLSISTMGAVVPVSTQTLELKPGWNLVTLTRPLDSMSGNVQTFLDMNPVRYDIGVRAYVFCDRSEDVKAGVGYWVFSHDKKTVELALDVDSAVVQPTLTKGWNLVGMTDGASWVKLDVPIWTWKNGCFVPVVDKSKLQVGNAYWIYINE